MSEVQINDLKKLAKQRNQQAIIAFCVERDGTVRCVTYGEDKLKCEAAGWWGQGFMKDNISVVPFQTVFGWGNGGEPQGISDYEKSFIIKGIVPEKFMFPKSANSSLKGSSDD